ncbi:brachyurin-like [Ischnura elegans]|uniref:brachyurin-like n=1 Tax=Ischnura elegans TaxID=197161 RepID=UPI001ED8A3D9|nr:brachyurin-like [Ischnura elegans]
MKAFLIVVVLIILGHAQTFEIKNLHPVGLEDASALKENGIHSAEPKIVGGVSASLGEIPFQVSIDVDTNWFIGGVIIHPWYILTSAKYIPGAKTFTIYAGVIKRHGDESSRQVMVATERYVHEDFNKTTLLADIALLKLPHQLEFNDYVSSAYLPADDYSFANDVAWISGWGSNHIHGEFAPILQVATVTIMSDEDCLAIWPHYVVNATICTRGEIGVGACNGDRGGPLFTNTTSGSRSLLVGTLTMHTLGTCGTDPDLFTRVSSYRQWITDHIE